MEQTKVNAGFFTRLLATFLNILIYFSLLSVPLFIAVITESTNLLQVGILTASLYMFSCVFYTTYLIYFVSHFGGDLGKLLFGLKILNSRDDSLLDFKTALYRQFPGYIFSVGFFGLGYLRVLKNPNKLAWHDELFGTRVVKSGSLIPGIIATVVLGAYLTFFAYSLTLTMGTI